MREKKMWDRLWRWSFVEKNKPVCGTCNQTFAMKKWLNKLIQNEDTVNWWTYCGKIFRNTKKVENHIYKACESTCHECSAKDKAENDIEDSVVQDADLIKEKDMEHKKIMREKENTNIWSPQYKREFWKGHLSQYELRLNIDEQQDDENILRYNET